MKYKLLILLLSVALIDACASHPKLSRHAQAAETSVVPPKPNATPDTAIVPPPKATEEIVPLSPYSSEGLLALNEFRSNNLALNDFLLRNRKPDYFFTSAHTEFKYQKIYLVYLGSDNLYLFDAQLAEPYKKFHPLPNTIKSSLEKFLQENHPAQEAIENATANNANTETLDTLPANSTVNAAIEKDLANRKPQPYLDQNILQTLSLASNGAESNSPIYPNLYYLDKNLNDILENTYSAKYEARKQKLKLIIPRAYETGGVYKDKNVDVRKIYLERNLATGKEMSLLVPDFFPGSNYYQDVHGKVIKAFASLYEVDVPQKVFDEGKIRMRYSIKLCQKDNAQYCVTKSDDNTYIRAIVIAATLYDSSTNTVIDTFVLK